MSLIRADARRLPIADGCVQCVVTSPPYWGLRDYGTATWVGGDGACDHVAFRKPPTVGSSSTLGYPSDGGQRRIADGNTYHEAYTAQYRDTCGKCGAQRVDAQLGLETTPDAYVANMVAAFRQAWRVLRDDGVLWLNLGDSYAGSWGAQSREHAGKHAPNVSALSANQVKAAAIRESGTGSLSRTPGLKPKDLVGIPWRVAFALQADGWYLRSDIIWAKPNPMPESVTDRPTKAHEYVFLLTKASSYYWDAEAVREAAEHRDWRDNRANAITAYPGAPNRYSDGPSGYPTNPNGRNIRSVWNITTQPYGGAHFAVMPETLAERCIAAGSRPGDLVLDPFLGSGTVARCAISMGRRAVGTDLNRAYLRLAAERTHVTRGLPLEMGA